MNNATGTTALFHIFVYLHSSQRDPLPSRNKLVVENVFNLTDWVDGQLDADGTPFPYGVNSGGTYAKPDDNAVWLAERRTFTNQLMPLEAITTPECFHTCVLHNDLFGAITRCNATTQSAYDLFSNNYASMRVKGAEIEIFDEMETLKTMPKGAVAIESVYNAVSGTNRQNLGQTGAFKEGFLAVKWFPEFARYQFLTPEGVNLDGFEHQSIKQLFFLGCDDEVDPAYEVDTNVWQTAATSNNDDMQVMMQQWTADPNLKILPSWPKSFRLWFDGMAADKMFQEVDGLEIPPYQRTTKLWIPTCTSVHTDFNRYASAIQFFHGMLFWYRPRMNAYIGTPDQQLSSTGTTTYYSRSARPVVRLRIHLEFKDPLGNCDFSGGDGLWYYIRSSNPEEKEKTKLGPLEILAADVQEPKIKVRRHKKKTLEDKKRIAALTTTASAAAAATSAIDEMELESYHDSDEDTVVLRTFPRQKRKPHKQ